MRAILIGFLVIISWTQATAHGDRPRATHIVFLDAHPDVAWILTDSQGIFANIKTGFRWLCEDAVAPLAGVRGLFVGGEEANQWAVATTQGLYTSNNSGCGFERASGVAGTHRMVGLWSHPTDTTLLTASSSVGYFNDLFRSDDGGFTWQGLGLQLLGRVRRVLWSPSDAGRIYLAHSHGFLRSLDGGEHFDAISPGTAAMMPMPSEVQLLAVDTEDPDLVFVAVENIPNTIILRSTDGGIQWHQVHQVADLDLRMVIDPQSGRILLSGPLGGSWRSGDGGSTWVEAPALPVNLDCLTVHPQTGHLWSCGDVYAGGPWVAAFSENFGEDWMPVLPNFIDTPERWDCPRESRGVLCCQGLCPGVPAGTECGQGSLVDSELCIQSEGEALEPTNDEPEPMEDGGMMADDMGASQTDCCMGGGSDGAVNGLDSSVAPGANSSGGCSMTMLPSASWSALMGLLLTLWWVALRKKSTAPC